MSNTTTTDSPALSEGVPYSEITRLVAEANPDLIEALEKASQEYHRLEDAWREEAARHQRNADMPRRCVESPHGRALREASTAVVEAFEAMLASGAVVYARQRWSNGRGA